MTMPVVYSEASDSIYNSFVVSTIDNMGSNINMSLSFSKQSGIYPSSSIPCP